MFLFLLYTSMCLGIPTRLALCSFPDIDLENIVYYKDDTHYFVMTAKKKSLLKKGVIKQVRITSIIMEKMWFLFFVYCHKLQLWPLKEKDMEWITAMQVFVCAQKS